MAGEVVRYHLLTEIRQPSMERYQIILAYNGSQYKGFQRQAKARTVQGVVEAALHKIGWQGKSILAAGRTDTGVHATGQVIAFDLDWKHDAQELQTALNSYLPTDVAAREARQVNPTFHPRYDASWRRYSYRIYCQAVRQPLLEPYAWRVWPAVELDALQEAASAINGTHDFGAFGTSPQAGGHTMRAVLQATWMQEQPGYLFEITAQAFLYHMVRRLVFTQVAIAQSRLTIGDLYQALETGKELSNHDGKQADLPERLVHGLAPAQGLVLEEVCYPAEVLELGEDNGIGIGLPGAIAGSGDNH